jgi:transcriptional regulator NrdR family protein
MSACPLCDYFDSSVIMTRKITNGWIKRWRTCQQEDCLHKWQTYEIPTTAIETEEDPELLKEIKRAMTDE